MMSGIRGAPVLFSMVIYHLFDNNKTLLFYKIYWSLLASRFLNDPRFILQITRFIRRYWYSVFHCSGITRSWYPISVYPSVVHALSVCACGTQFLRAHTAQHPNWMHDWGDGSVKLRGRLRKIILAQN